MSDILIVDDNSDNLRLLADLLITQGYKIRAVRDGISAISTINKKIPDLILLDIMMPEPDGYEVCRQIKNIEKYKDIPIIFITALTENMNKAQAFQSGGIDYITKPIQTDEVLTCINTHLELHMFKTMNNRQKSKKYNKVNLPEYKRKEYAKKLEHYMDTEEPFLDEDLSIPLVAKSLTIPQHHLSMTINIEFKRNFYSYINAHRIKYAEEILQDSMEKNESILMIAYRSGFKSKSSFNQAFKLINGMTPTEFRKSTFI